MSTPPPSAHPPESKPSPWLLFAWPVALALVGGAVNWGTLGADVRHLDRRQTATEAEVARVSAAQSTAAAQSARIEARLDALSHELGRLTRAVERLADEPRARR
jgi:hypothetical protein